MISQATYYLIKNYLKEFCKEVTAHFMSLEMLAYEK